jgi:hypothetical protein
MECLCLKLAVSVLSFCFFIELILYLDLRRGELPVYLGIFYYDCDRSLELDPSLS